MNTNSKRGIYLVANLHSQSLCENLVYSIRQSGCTLPIRVIHFGGEKINSSYLLKEVAFLEVASFSEDARQFVSDMASVINECPLGFLYRFLGWFSDWDEFIYADNDIVAMSNWETFFQYMDEGGYDIVHADEEYTTGGRFNYHKPGGVESIFGKGSLETAITAGHFAVRRSDRLIKDMRIAFKWFGEHPEIPIRHDQALLHIASLLGNWKMLNLCKPPHNWLSSWSGDYKNPLQIIHLTQNRKISHIHYSGSTPFGDRPIEDLLYSYGEERTRLNNLASLWLKKRSGWAEMLKLKRRAIKKLKKMRKK